MPCKNIIYYSPACVLYDKIYIEIIILYSDFYQYTLTIYHLLGSKFPR